MNKKVSVWCSIFLMFAFSFILLSCAKNPARQQTAEDMKTGKEEAKKVVVAAVNTVLITMDSLVRMMNRMSITNHGDLPADYMEEIKKTALDRLIVQELAYQKAKTLGLKVEQKNVDAAIANFKENTGGEKQAAEFLAKEGLTEAEIRAQVERSLTLELIYAREVAAKVTIPQEEMQSEYEKEKALYITPEKIKLTDVIVFAKPGEQEARKKAKELLKKIRADKEGNPWSLTLDGTFLVRNLDLGKGNEREKEKQLYNEAKKMKPGKLSGIIKTDDGLHIIKLLEYSPQRQMTFDEVKGSIDGKLRVRGQQKRLEEWSAELKKDAKIEIKDAKIAVSEPGGDAQEKKN